MKKASNFSRCLIVIASVLILCWPHSVLAQGTSADGGEVAKPVTLRVGVPNKKSDREVVFPLIVETSGSASVGRVRAELELSSMQSWLFRSVEITRGLDLRSTVKKRNEGQGKLVLEWDVSGAGRELPTGHVALVTVQAAKGSKADADSPPTLVIRKMSWGLAEFEKQKENLQQLETPENPNNNPDVSCFFFTH